jgi:hypothetical protein
MLHSFLCIHEIYLCIHAIGVPERVTLLEFEGAHQEEEQEQPEEPEVPASEESAVDPPKNWYVLRTGIIGPFVHTTRS